MADYDTDKWEPVGGDDSAATSPYTRNASFAKSGPYITKLTPGEQAKFQSWVKANKVPYDPSATADYDMPGYWKDVVARGGSKTAVNPVDKRLHYPDTYKTPYHESFSNESRYATKNNPFKWKGETLIDSRTGKSVYETQAPKKEAPVGLDTSKWSVVPPGTDASLASKPAEMSAGGPLGTAPGPITEAVEEAIRTGAFMGGEAAGEAGGLASAPVTGAAGPLAGPSIGAGIGGTLGDAATALYNHMMFHTPIDVSAKNLLADAGINVGGAVGGGLAAKGIGKVATGVKDLVTGAPGIRAGAQQTLEKATEAEEGAVAKQGAANLAERTDVYQKAQTKAEVAAKAQAEKNQKEIAAAAEKARLAKEDFLTKQADAERKALEQNEKLKTQTAAELAPQARAARFGQTFGRGPGGAEAARTESAEAFEARKQALYKTVNEPLNDFSANWGQQRDKLLAGSMDSQIETTPIGEAIEQQNQYLAQHPGMTFSRPVQKLLDLASGLSSKQPVQLTDVLQGKGAMTLDEYRKIATTRGLVDERGVLPRELDMGGGAQVKSLLSARSLASALTSSSDGANKTAARSIMNGVDKAIADDPNLNSKLPGLKRLNAAWRNHKELFPDSLRDDITAGVPAQFGPQMFDHPQRALTWMRLAKPQQKMAMRDLYADYVHDGLAQGKDIDKLIKPVHADFLKTVMPHTPFATREGITHLTTGAMSLEETLASSPEVRQQFLKSALPAMRGTLLDKMGKVTSEAVKQARNMGPLGEQFIKRVQGPGLDRTAQFKMSIEFMTGSSPDQIAKSVAQEQVDPRVAALTANAGQTPSQVMGGLNQKSPQVAGREAIMGMDVPSATSKGAPIPSPTTPQEAAIGAIRGGATAKTSGRNYFIERAKAFWPLYLIIGGPVLASGHLNYGGAMLLMGAGAAASGPIRRAFAQSLEDPRTAQAFWNGILKPTAPGSLATVGQYAGRAVMSDIVSRAMQSMTGVSLENAPPPSTPKPTTKKPPGYLGS